MNNLSERSLETNTSQILGIVPSSNDAAKTSVVPQELVNAILCGACPRENPKKLCGRCRSIKYCNQGCQQKHWTVHKKNCVEVKVIKQIEELFPIIKACFDTNKLSNTPIHFKFETDGVGQVPRNLRIIHNPTQLPLKAGVMTIGHQKILGGDETLSKEVIELIQKQFSINVVLCGTINDVSGFRSLENIQII